MNKQEFLLLIPAIIYGVAIVDLLKIFQHKKNYLEMVSWGIYVMMVVIFSWTELYYKLELIADSTLSFFLIIAQAILVASITAIITPEEKHTDTKKYFLEVRKSFFLLMTVSMIYSMFLQYFVYDDSTVSWMRPLGISLFLICAFVDKFWVRMSIFTVVIGLGILRIFTDLLIQAPN